MGFIFRTTLLHFTYLDQFFEWVTLVHIQKGHSHANVKNRGLSTNYTIFNIRIKGLRPVFQFLMFRNYM